MNYDEFAFFNHQLAAMLRSGIPLEGGLKQLSADMRRGRLRAEIKQLEDDLGRGTPLKEALAKRPFPDFYRRMVEIGVRSDDLPGMLTLVADHYQRAHALWTRLKGLMVYPVIVLALSLALTLVLSLLCHHFLESFSDQFGQLPGVFAVSVWIPPAAVAVIGAIVAAGLSRPRWRAWLRWRLPAFREASLAQLASALALMLRKGTPLAEALALAQALEGATPASPALAQWRFFVEAGQGKPTRWYKPMAPFPPLFLWLVQTGGEDPAAGFDKAAEIYHARATYRIELALYGALPVSILFLGQMIIWQMVPLFRAMSMFLNMLGSSTGGPGGGWSLW